jgi:ElaB/YqjD/DUF883 family membrane-anchored ribosome-binding protein
MFTQEPTLAEKLAEDVKRLTQDLAAVKEKIEWKHRLHDQRKGMQESAQEVGEQADEYVRDNAWISVGVAVLAGVVLGVLAGQAKRD